MTFDSVLENKAMQQDKLDDRFPSRCTCPQQKDSQQESGRSTINTHVQPYGPATVCMPENRHSAPGIAATDVVGGLLPIT